jgi:hypothetical protein
VGLPEGKTFFIKSRTFPGSSAMFDWVTWSIWSIGLLILIVWVYVPLKEFMQLLHERKVRKEESPSAQSGD